MKLRVLFVDDDKFLLAGLRRLLRSKRKIWDMEFAENGEAAVELLNAGEFDAVVSDMRMPGMDGSQLLEKTRELQPKAARLILSGQSDLEQALQTIGPAHRYLTKPCRGDELVNAVNQAIETQQTLNSNKLGVRHPELNALSIDRMPLIDQMQQVATGASATCRVVEQNNLATRYFLKLVNAANNEKIESVNDATAIFGAEPLQPLLIASAVLAEFPAEWPTETEKTFFLRAVVASRLAEQMAKSKYSDAPTICNLTVAGLLHDIGLAFWWTRDNFQFQQLINLANPSLSLSEASTSLFQTRHPITGACLLEKCGLPHMVVESVLHQDCSANDLPEPQSDALKIIAIASSIADRKVSNYGFSPKPLVQEWLHNFDGCELLTDFATST